jgi:hypothetical protein
MDYLAAVWSAMTWRRVLITQALGQTAAILTTLEWGYYGDFMHHRSLHFVCMSAYVLCLLPVALGAEEAIRRGARTRLVYPALLLVNPVLGCCVALVTLQLYLAWFHIPLLKGPDSWGFVEGGIHMSVYTSFGLLIFMNQRTTDRMLEAVRGAELKRVELDRQLIESRLATAEAQIDPRLLLVVLADVKHGFERSEPDAERKLDDLIHTLRKALARTAAVNTESQDA